MFELWRRWYKLTLSISETWLRMRGVTGDTPPLEDE